MNSLPGWILYHHVFCAVRQISARIWGPPLTSRERKKQKHMFYPHKLNWANPTKTSLRHESFSSTHVWMLAAQTVTSSIKLESCCLLRSPCYIWENVGVPPIPNIHYKSNFRTKPDLVSLHLQFNDRGTHYSLPFSLKKQLVFPQSLPKKEIFFYQEVSCGLTISFQCKFASFMYLKQLTVALQGLALSNSSAVFCLLGAAGETEQNGKRKQHY